MAQGTKFKTFKEFWPEYLRLHSKPITRAVHYIGTLGGIALAGAGIAIGAPALIIAAPVFTYGLLFPSHPIFEKNVPATIKNPFMSIGGDFKMLFCWMTGQLKNEYKKHGLDYTGKTGNNQNDPTVIRPAASASSGPSFLASAKLKLTHAFSKAETGANDNAPVAVQSKPEAAPKI